MAYASAAYAVELYGLDYVLTSFDLDQDGSVDEALADMMLEVASSEMDSFFQGRVPLPIPEDKVPLDLKMRCVDIAIYRAATDPLRASVIKETRFKAAQDWLKMVARNEIKLSFEGASLGTHLTQRAETVIAARAHREQDPDARRFSRKRLKGIL